MARIVVVVPTYNRARTVARAVDSVLAQDRGDVACLVVDDGSTDDTAAVLARYAGDRRVSVVRREANGGVTAAKNTGLDHLPADCEYFGILDSDDVLVPGALGALARVFDAGHDYSQVFGWCEDPDTGGRTGTMHAGSVLTYEAAICGGMEGEFWQLVRRDVLGDLRFETRAAGGESSLWWRLLKKSPGYIVPDVVRLYDRSGTDRVSRLRFDPASCTRHMWTYRALLDAVGEDLEARCPRRYAAYRLEEAKWAALGGARAEAWSAVASALRVAPTLRSVRVAALTLLPALVLRRVYQRRYAAELAQ